MPQWHIGYFELTLLKECLTEEDTLAFCSISPKAGKINLSCEGELPATGSQRDTLITRDIGISIEIYL